MKTIILDNGHGQDTPGKRSPKWKDGTQLFEWEFSRDVVRHTEGKLKALGFDVRVIVPEVNDISLGERVRRTNAICKEKGAGNCLFASVHANGGGGTGFEVYTTRGKTKSDDFATVIYEEAVKMWGNDWRIRTDGTDGDPDKEADFTVIKGANCPAVLIEYFFMDTERDCRYIMSQEGRDACAEVLTRAIVRYCNQSNKA